MPSRGRRWRFAGETCYRAIARGSTVRETISTVMESVVPDASRGTPGASVTAFEAVQMPFKPKRAVLSLPSSPLPAGPRGLKSDPTRRGRSGLAPLSPRDGAPREGAPSSVGRSERFSPNSRNSSEPVFGIRHKLGLSSDPPASPFATLSALFTSPRPRGPASRGAHPPPPGYPWASPPRIRGRSGRRGTSR